MKVKVWNRKWARRLARKARVRTGMRGSDRVRLTVFRSTRHIYAQLDDPVTGRTLGAISTRCPGVADGAESKVDAARKVGAAVATLAREKQIEKVVFNRNGFLYHGRVKALADAARDAGLQF